MSAVLEAEPPKVTKEWHYDETMRQRYEKLPEPNFRKVENPNQDRSHRQKYRNKVFARLFVSTGFNAIDALRLMDYPLSTARRRSSAYLSTKVVQELIDKELERVLKKSDRQIQQTIADLVLIRQEAMTVVIDKETGEPRMKCLDTALRCLELELQYFGGMKKLAMQNACESMFVKPDEYEQSLIQEASD